MFKKNIFKFYTNIMRLLAKIIILFFKKSNKKRIWMIGAYGGKAYGDNSKILYEYILKNHKEIDIYWVINKKSADIKKIPGPFFYSNSLKAYVYCLLSDVIIVSHGLSDLPTFKIKDLKKIEKVYLSHGIQGLKKAANSAFKNQFDKVFVTSKFQKEIYCEYMDVDSRKVSITGLPRYDYLKFGRDNEIIKKSKKILYMPTWRDWLNKDNLEKSDYYERILSLKNDLKLNELLEQHNYKLNVYFHIYMNFAIEKIQNEFLGTNIVFLPINSDLQKEILESEILITDYSSVSWDFLYMNKEVIFYQFDLQKYKSTRGSYIELNDNLFGSVVYEQNTLINVLETIINDKKNENIEKQKIYWKKMVFEYSDANNSKRIVKNLLENNKEV